MIRLSEIKPTALLFSYTHDLLQSEAALDNLLTHRRYITNPENFDRPWAKIAPRLEDFRVSRQGPGWRYLASGRLRAF